MSESPSDQLLSEIRELASIVQELVDTLASQTKELERFTLRTEQQTDPRDHPSEFSIAVSRLNALRRQINTFVERLDIP